MIEFTEQEKRQLYTACWNERAKLQTMVHAFEEAQKNNGSIGVMNQLTRCSTDERIELLDSIIKKLKP